MTFDIGDSSLIFKGVSLFLKENYMPNLEISEVFSLSLAKTIYKYLEEYFPKISDRFENIPENLRTGIESISEVFFNKCEVFEEDRSTAESFTLKPYNRLYDRNKRIKPVDIDSINEYNIASWEINEQIMQFLDEDTVITENSSMEEIAQMQKMARALDYIDKGTVGIIDADFVSICLSIQLQQREIDKRIVPHGYCDIYVEKYLRSINEVRMNTY